MHSRCPLNGIVLDMDSSVSETYGNQEGPAFKAHFAFPFFFPGLCFSAMNQIQCNCGAVYEAVNPKDRTQGQDLFNVEYSLSPNWSAKVEYLHLDLGTASLFSAASAASSLSVPISDDLVRAGVNYHW